MADVLPYEFTRAGRLIELAILSVGTTVNTQASDPHPGPLRVLVLGLHRSTGFAATINGIFWSPVPLAPNAWPASATPLYNRAGDTVDGLAGEIEGPVSNQWMIWEPYLIIDATTIYFIFAHRDTAGGFQSRCLIGLDYL